MINNIVRSKYIFVGNKKTEIFSNYIFGPRKVRKVRNELSKWTLESKSEYVARK